MVRKKKEGKPTSLLLNGVENIDNSHSGILSKFNVVSDCKQKIQAH